VTEGKPSAGQAIVLLTGRAPARTVTQLVDMLRDLDAGKDLVAMTAIWLSGGFRRVPACEYGYVRDLAWWLRWAKYRSVDLRDVPASEAGRYTAALRDARLTEITRARRTSAAASWYASMTRSGTVRHDPFSTKERPVGPSRLGPLPERERTRLRALMALVASTGCRVPSLIGARIGGLGDDSGGRIIDLPVKSGGMRRFAMEPGAARAIDSYLDERAAIAGLPRRQALEPAAPLLSTGTGQCLTHLQVHTLMRRAGGAG
jgi:site-specific recombinase XerD